ncbi:hypothetical protein BGZ65_006292 [Modicella reniformis]|uniref:Uncharacterized protein n=1 Tax=Modicella reniformis TaxID=1440133 RepID=A0A9P6ST50_9FUNG|nr:hypothetical protein BGZ65_006292 [Modicella reniformis]
MMAHRPPSEHHGIRISNVLGRLQHLNDRKPVPTFHNFLPLDQQLEKLKQESEALNPINATTSRPDHETRAMQLGTYAECTLEDILDPDDYEEDEDETTDQYGDKSHDRNMEDIHSNTDTPRKKLRALQTILKSLIESSSIEGQVDEDDVRTNAHIGTELYDNEIQVLVKLGNLLRPYTPRKRTGDRAGENPLAHVALRAPLVIIANAVLRYTGYSMFCRRIAPQVSTGALYALPLGSVGVYEVFGGSGSDRFDLFDGNDTLVSNTAVATRSESDRRAMIGCMFDLNKINAICQKHQLRFINRLTYVDQYTIRISGTVVPHGTERRGFPESSSYEERKKKQRGRVNHNQKWAATLKNTGWSNDELGEKALHTAELISQLEPEIKELRVALSNREKERALAAADVKRNAPDAYSKLRAARTMANREKDLLDPKEAQDYI